MMIKAKTHADVKGPGVYVGLPFGEYLKIPAVNHSLLKRMEDSPLHFKWEQDNPEDHETVSKRMGTQTHTLLLEPDKFGGNIIAPPINPRTGEPYGSTTKAWAEYAAEHPGKVIMSDEEVSRVRGMIREVKAHRTAANLLFSDPSALSEVVMVWDEGPIRCKGRVDRLTSSHRIDLKTTGDAARWDVWRNSAVKFNYHTQEAFYRRGAVALNLAREGVFVAVESEPPHGVGVFSLMDEWVEVADKMVVEWLNKLAAARAAGEYRGYPDDRVEVVPPPQWFISRYMDGEM